VGLSYTSQAAQMNAFTMYYNIRKFWSSSATPADARPGQPPEHGGRPTKDPLRSAGPLGL